MKIIDVVCGNCFSIILTKEKKKVKVYATGAKIYGKLGLGNLTSDAKEFVEIISLADKKIRKVFTKYNHVVAVSKDN